MKVVIPNYTGPLRATYDTVWTPGQKRIDWRQYLTDEDLQRLRLPRYTYEGWPGWYPDYSRPYYMVDELVLTAFNKLPKPLPPLIQWNRDSEEWEVRKAESLPLWLYIPRHLNGDYRDSHLDNLEWVLDDDALQVYDLRRRSVEERLSALVNSRQGRCRAS